MVIELFLETGVRVMEASQLCCGDLELDPALPAVNVRRGKGGKSRLVFIQDSFVDTCRRFLDWKASIGEPVDDSAPLLRSSHTGRGLSIRALQKAFERICKRAHVHGHSIHHCRHTYVSALRRASGNNLDLVKEQAGHSSIQVTQVYDHVYDDEIHDALKRLYKK